MFNTVQSNYLHFIAAQSKIYNKYTNFYLSDYLFVFIAYPSQASSPSASYSLIEINKGGNDKTNQETWIHPKLAVQLAQWISADFALQVSEWILDLFTNGKVEINIKLLKEKEKEIKLIN